jgi:hypothetical protein
MATKVGIDIEISDDESNLGFVINSSNLEEHQFTLQKFRVDLPSASILSEMREGTTLPYMCDNSIDYNSPKTPAQPEGNATEFEEDLIWTKICRNKRGKHPRKKRTP